MPIMTDRCFDVPDEPETGQGFDWLKSLECFLKVLWETPRYYSLVVFWKIWSRFAGTLFPRGRFQMESRDHCSGIDASWELKTIQNQIGSYPSAHIPISRAISADLLCSRSFEPVSALEIETFPPSETYFSRFYAP